MEQFLAEFCIISSVDVVVDSAQGLLLPSKMEGLHLLVEHARGVKCPRCWQWQETSHADGLCERCYAIVS